MELSRHPTTVYQAVAAQLEQAVQNATAVVTIYPPSSNWPITMR